MTDPPFDTAVVDIDGTLLDSTYHHTLAWARALALVGCDVPAWRIHRAIGMGGDRLVTAVAGAEIEDRHGDAVRERWEQEFDAMIDQTTLLPGARELLDGLAAAGLRVVLASSSIPRHAEHPLRLLRAEDRTSGWTTSADAEASKPDPELIDVALDRLPGEPGRHRALLIGDSVWDVEAAARAELPTVGVRSGGFSESELLGAGAAAVYDDPADLLARLDEALGLAARHH